VANRNPKRLLTGLWIAVAALALIGMTAAVLRTLAVAGFFDYLAVADRVAEAIRTLRPPEEVRADARMVEGRYALHPLLLLAHALPAFFFMLLGPLQFVPRIRERHILLHRRSGLAIVVSGLWVGVSAIVMPFRFPLISGLTEVAAVLSFGIFFLFALGKAFLHIRRHEIASHREWMIRAFAVGLGIAADRPIDIAFEAFTHMRPREHFGIALWISLLSLSLVAEAWIRHTRAPAKLSHLGIAEGVRR